MSLFLILTSDMVSPQFHVGHANFRYNSCSSRTKSKWQQLSGIDLTVTLEKPVKINRAALRRCSAVNPNAAYITSNGVENRMSICESTRTAILEPGVTVKNVSCRPVKAPAAASASDPAHPVNPVTNLSNISLKGGGHRNISKRIQAIVDSGETKGNIRGFQSTFETQHDQDMDLQYRMRIPIALISDINGDTIYFHQDIHQEHSADFVEAVVKEINGHVDNEHWKLVPIADSPEEEELIPSVWAMRRKQNLFANNITK